MVIALNLRVLLMAVVSVASAAFPQLPCECTNGTMYTPTYGTANAVFAVCAQLTINAPPSKIYPVLVAFDRYHLWNSFVYAVDLPANYPPAYVNMTMVMHTTGLVAGVNTTSTESVTFLEPRNWPVFAAWKSGTNEVDGLLFEAEHPTALVDLGRGRARYVSWETYYGPGAVVLQTIQPQLQTEFEKEGEDLKSWVESLS